jgi:hypothetical protein
MSTLYRAIWSDATSTSASLDELRGRVAAWALEDPDAAPLAEGKQELVVSQERHRGIMHRAVGDTAFEVITTDRTPGDVTEWVTLVRVIANETGLHTLVELAMSSDDLDLRVSVGRPKVVHELLEAAARPRLAGSRLQTESVAIPANAIEILVDLLSDPERSLPLIVCSATSNEREPNWLRVAASIASRAEGVATVVTLDTAAVDAFKRTYDDLAIWGGGIRVYAPGAVTRESDQWRHRYYLRSRIEEATQSTVDRIVYSVTQLSTRRRVPLVFEAFDHQMGLPADALDGMIPAADLAAAREAWVNERAAHRVQSETQRDQYERELEDLRDQQNGLARELAHANGHLARLKEELLTRELADVLWGTEHEVESDTPDEVQAASEAALAAQVYLSEWLVVPDSSIRDLEDIDTAPNAYAWGNTTWRGLRALAAYAKDRADGWNKGDFWQWCASGPPLGWPATPKKLSMTESASVQNNEKFRRARVFKVDRAVENSGEILMLAHLKISEGGGNLAPRVYFHDDTAGATGKVHVGLIGPHYLVPNKQT